MNVKNLALNSFLKIHFLTDSSLHEIRKCFVLRNIISCSQAKLNHNYIHALFFHHGVKRSASVASDLQSLKEQKDTFTSLQSANFKDIPIDQPVTHDNLIAILKKCNSVQEQMEMMPTLLGLSEEDIERRVKFTKFIESLICPFFDNIKLRMFGSSVNRFGFKGCDIDMSFRTSVKPKYEPVPYSQDKKKSYLDRPDVPLIQDVICGKVSPLEISCLSPKEQLLFIHSILLEYYKESSDAPLFINAHVPIIRFYHDEYNMKCDLSYGNRVAFLNTKLLFVYGKLDKRVKPFMMTIRYWAKHVELIGKGLTFNTYTLSLLAIFYLQNRNPPIIPSTEYIISLSDCFDDIETEDEKFLELIKKIPPSKNNETLEELLQEFFYYYMYFDFSRVICPMTATSIPREEFFSKKQNSKFRNNHICVQDPMLLSHNVADLVDYKSCKKLTFEMMVGYKFHEHDSFHTPKEENWGLLTLFDKTPNSMKRLTKNLGILEVPLVHKNDMQANVNLEDAAKEILSILEKGLLFECEILEPKEVCNILKWQDKVTENQKKILASVLKLDENTHRDRSYQYQNLDKENEGDSTFTAFQALNVTHNLILCAKCTVAKNTWLGRNHLCLENLTNDVTKDSLQMEHFISLKVAKKNAQDTIEKNTKPFNFLCEVYSSPETSSSLFVYFRPLQKASFNPVLEIFLRKYLPNIVGNLSS